MRKFMDFHDTKFALVPAGTNSPAPGLLGTTAINCLGFGRARFAFLLGLAGTGATFSSGIIMAATNSGMSGNTTSITALPPVIMVTGQFSSILVVDCALPQSAGTGSVSAWSWLCVTSASVVVSSIPVIAIVDLYNAVSHAPSNTPGLIITI